MALSWKYRRPTSPVEHSPISQMRVLAALLLLEDTTPQLVAALKTRSRAEGRGAETPAGILSPRRILGLTWPGRQSNCVSGWDRIRLRPAPDGTLTEFLSPMAPVQPWPISPRD